MGKFGIGQAIERVEDARLLTGRGRYTDDIDLKGQAYGHVLRSPYAHARIRKRDAAAARAAPGVLAVYSADELAKAGLGPIPCLYPLARSEERRLGKECVSNGSTR